MNKIVASKLVISKLIQESTKYGAAYPFCKVMAHRSQYKVIVKSRSMQCPRGRA